MQENTSITSVDLADNLIKEAGAEALAAMLKVLFLFLFFLVFLFLGTFRVILVTDLL